jgi:hypothetical protein
MTSPTPAHDWPDDRIERTRLPYDASGARRITEAAAAARTGLALPAETA